MVISIDLLVVSIRIENQLPIDPIIPLKEICPLKIVIYV